MTTISVYAFTPTVFEYLDQVRLSKRGERELTAAIMAMVDGGRPVGHVRVEERHHVTYPQDLLAVNLHFLKEGRDANILSDLSKEVEVIAPVRVDPHVSVGQGAVIGPNVYLERGTVIGQSVRLKNAVVLGRTISAGQTVIDEIVDENR
jgi:glucose-1-phosphate thymidylyltransferase